MEPRRWNARLCFGIACLTLAIAGPARAQPYGTLANYGYPTVDLYGHGYGSTPTGGYSSFPYGYAPLNGNMGAGYQGAGALINEAVQATAPKAPAAGAARQGFDVTTATPGFYTPGRRARHRPRAQAEAPATPPINAAGKIDWPSSIPDEPSLTALRHAADETVLAVFEESKTKGHASVRPVIEAKNKLIAFERKVLPEVKAKDAAAGTALEHFFLHLDKALDELTFRK